jgi:hypothetical protein
MGLFDSKLRNQNSFDVQVQGHRRRLYFLQLCIIGLLDVFITFDFIKNIKI